jgi:hypothetical protein
MVHASRGRCVQKRRAWDGSGRKSRAGTVRFDVPSWLGVAKVAGRGRETGRGVVCEPVELVRRGTDGHVLLVKWEAVVLGARICGWV